MPYHHKKTVDMKNLMMLLLMSIPMLGYAQWNGVYFHADGESAFQVLNKDTIIAVTHGGGRIHRTTNGGQSWSFYQTEFTTSWFLVAPAPAVVAQPLVVTAAPAVVAPIMANPETVHLSTRSDLVGRAFVDSMGNPLGTVNYVAVMPGTTDARYVVVSGPPFGAGNQVFVPISQIHMSGGRVMADVPTATLMQSQRFSYSEMQRFAVAN